MDEMELQAATDNIKSEEIQAPAQNQNVESTIIDQQLSPKQSIGQTSQRRASLQRSISGQNEFNQQNKPSPGQSIGHSPQRRSSPQKNIQKPEEIPIHTPNKSIGSPSRVQNTLGVVAEGVNEVVNNLEPKSLRLSDHINELTETVNKLSRDIANPLTPIPDTNINKIANMSKVLTDEASALRQSIRCLSEDIVETKRKLLANDASNRCPKEDVNFPYHLFLIEIIVNKIHMKCDCFDIDFNNLEITATFLGKNPIALYDSSYEKLDDLSRINVGKSILFAMTYDKICNIKDFEIAVELTKKPPCSSCVQKIGETHMDYTNDFNKLREELCKKWMSEQPNDNIICTTSLPLSKNMYYVTCGDSNHQDSIGVIEVSVRMSFLGKEITTTFSGSTKQKNTNVFSKDDRGMAMYSCQNVEMDEQGKVLLDENVFKKPSAYQPPPMSQVSIMSPKQHFGRNYFNSNAYDNEPKYDEILTRMNANELKIKVPKSTRIERMGKYDKIQELCDCESTPYNTGEQLQFQLPTDLCGPDKSHRTHTADLQYTYNGCDRSCDPKNRKVINVTPTNCPVPVAMEKMIHPQKDVFILKIGKKLETRDKKTELEIELTTPKGPERLGDKFSDLAQQCSKDKLSLRAKTSKTGSKKGKKGKGKATKGKDKKGAKKKGKKK